PPRDSPPLAIHAHGHAGSPQPTVLVDDLGNVGTGGPLTFQSAVAITGLSAAQQAGNLTSQGTPPQTAGVLARKDAGKPLDKLHLKGKKDDSHKVEDFLKEVANPLHKKVLTQDQADALTFWANLLLSSLTVSDR